MIAFMRSICGNRQPVRLFVPIALLRPALSMAFAAPERSWLRSYPGSLASPRLRVLPEGQKGGWYKMV
jgi:hypothetical protein